LKLISIVDEFLPPFNPDAADSFDDMLLSWHQVLCILIANRTPGDSVVISALGDRLYEYGLLQSAQVWYLIFCLIVSSYLLSQDVYVVSGRDAPGVKLVLLGAVNSFVDEDAISAASSFMDVVVGESVEPAVAESFSTGQVTTGGMLGNLTAKSEVPPPVVSSPIENAHILDPPLVMSTGSTEGYLPSSCDQQGDDQQPAVDQQLNSNQQQYDQQPIVDQQSYLDQQQYDQQPIVDQQLCSDQQQYDHQQNVIDQQSYSDQQQYDQQPIVDQQSYLDQQQYDQQPIVDQQLCSDQQQYDHQQNVVDQQSFSNQQQYDQQPVVDQQSYSDQQQYDQQPIVDQQSFSDLQSSVNQSLPSMKTIELSTSGIDENAIQVAKLSNDAKNVIDIKSNFNLTSLLEIAGLSSMVNEDGSFVSGWIVRLINRLKWVRVFHL
jgi:hypothetical protein